MAKRNAKDTAEYWIEKLQLTAHPGLETGFLNENFRDEHKVIAANGKERSGATNIYFLHKPAPPFDDSTVFFRMSNVELLNYYRGSAPLSVYVMPDPTTAETEKRLLGPDFEAGERYFTAIPRGLWFVRRLETDDPAGYALIGCTLSSGYAEGDIETKTYGEIAGSLGSS